MQHDLPSAMALQNNLPSAMALQHNLLARFHLAEDFGADQSVRRHPGN